MEGRAVWYVFFRDFDLHHMTGLSWVLHCFLGLFLKRGNQHCYAVKVIDGVSPVYYEYTWNRSLVTALPDDVFYSLLGIDEYVVVGERMGGAGIGVPTCAGHVAHLIGVRGFYATAWQLRKMLEKENP